MEAVAVGGLDDEGVAGGQGLGIAVEGDAVPAEVTAENSRVGAIREGDLNVRGTEMWPAL